MPLLASVGSLAKKFVPFSEYLRALDDYKVAGFMPEPGMVVESLDSITMKWRVRFLYIYPPAA